MELHEDSSSGFKIFTISTTTLSVIIVNSVFLHDPWYHPEDYPKYYGLFYTSVYTLLYCMWTWAYIITLSAPRKPPKSMIIGKTEGRCERCRIHKPERAHHCSTCGLCTEKMDHHCVWTNRCIGYRNYKSFLQFIGFLSIGTYVYDYLAICFLLRDNKDIGPLVVVIVFLETSIVLLTTFLSTALFLAHCMMAAINLSTIEYMKGKPFRYFWAQDTEGRNIHDLGVVQNLVQIFGNNPLTWLVPTLVAERESGCFFPSIPEAQRIDQVKVVSS